MTDPDWRHLPSLSSLRAFEAAARLGGFSAAARALNVTHAAVAQAVRGLESELGLTLLRREGRGLALTEEGARLARSLREGFSAIAAGVEALRGAERRRGLRVTCMPSFAQQLLLPRLGDFWRRHPEIAVSISPSLAAVDLAREGFDLAIRIGEPPWPGTEAEHLLDARLLLVAAPSLLERGQDLARLPWVIDPSDAYVAGLLRGGGLDPAALAPLGIDDPLLELAAARAGYGLLFATDAVVRGDLAAGRLRALPFPACRATPTGS
jgi:LysR family glycine cleavage system transcriptional activator